MVGVDPNAKKDAERTAKALDSFVGKLDGMRDKFRAAGMAVSDQTKESDKLQFRLDKLAASFAAAQAQAADLGPEAVAAFEEVETGMIASMNAIAAAIPRAQRRETGAAIGGAMQGAAGLQERRDRFESQGASEEQLAAAGLSDEDIAAAGEVTDADIAQAEEQTDRGEIMGQVAADAVRGVIDGIKSIVEGLPDIIEELIPILLFELPPALIKSLGKLLVGFAKNLFINLPRAIFQGVSNWFGRVKKFLADLFSFGFATGGYVSRTGMALVHQGERVIPSNGAGTGTATAGLQAFMGQPSTNLTINTATVDPDSIPALGRLLERDLGAHGRVENDLFGTVAPFTSL